MVILYSACVESEMSDFIAISFQYIWNNNLWLQTRKKQSNALKFNVTDSIEWMI